MGKIKDYTIVTNDEYELPVASVHGAKQVADFLGITVNRVRKNLHYGRWNHKGAYKAYVEE